MILVIGSINMDVSFRVRELPRPGETVLACSCKKSPGGKGANQAVAAARLGSQVIMLGCLGDDEDSQTLIRSMRDAGVNTDHLRISKGQSAPCAFICVSDSGENCIVVNPSTNQNVTPEYLLENEALFDKVSHCVMQMEIPAETVKTALELCKKHQVQAILNPSPVSGLDPAFLQGVDVLIPNENEAACIMGAANWESLTPDSMQAFVKEHQIGCMIVTLGDRGCVCIRGQEPLQTFETKPQRAVDTTGAGDTFLGALVTILAEGGSLPEAIRFANASSGLQVMRPGAQEAMPTREMVEYEQTEHFA